jgi:hypothetical protein
VYAPVERRRETVTAISVSSSGHLFCCGTSNGNLAQFSVGLPAGVTSIVNEVCVSSWTFAMRNDLDTSSFVQRPCTNLSAYIYIYICIIQRYRRLCPLRRPSLLRRHHCPRRLWSWARRMCSLRTRRSEKWYRLFRVRVVNPTHTSLFIA